MNFFLKLTSIIFLFSNCECKTPVINFPKGITWLDVFDSGLRPKYVDGLEKIKVQCRGVKVIFKFGDSGEMSLDRGRLTFNILKNEKINLIEHISREAITLEKAKKRLKHFRKIMGDNLEKPGRLPAVVDKATGGVIALANNSAVADREGYIINYYFTASFKKENPVLPIFMISIKKSMQHYPIRRDKIIPTPDGYEWYSLDANTNPEPPEKPFLRRDDSEPSNVKKIDGSDDAISEKDIRPKKEFSTKNKNTTSHRESLNVQISKYKYLLIIIVILFLLSFSLFFLFKSRNK